MARIYSNSKIPNCWTINLVKCENCVSVSAFSFHCTQFTNNIHTWTCTWMVHAEDFHYKILGGQATVAKEFAIYLKIKVSKSMTNSVRYVFAHCSRLTPSPYPPPPSTTTSSHPSATYDGAPLIYLHTKAQQTEKKSLALNPPLVAFSSYAHFWRQPSRVDWVGCQQSGGIKNGGGLQGPWNAVRVHEKYIQNQKSKWEWTKMKVGVSLCHRTYFKMSFIAPEIVILNGRTISHALVSNFLCIFSRKRL